MVRIVEQKKTSVVMKGGSIAWRMCEAVILVCPAVSRDGRTSAVSGQILSDSIDVTANKRARVARNSEESQSDLSTAKDIENTPSDDANGQKME